MSDNESGAELGAAFGKAITAMRQGTDMIYSLKSELAISNTALTESQARAARLEEAMKELVSQINEFANKWGEADFYTGDAIKALADSPNSWLQERLKAERERCASISPNGLAIIGGDKPHIVWEKFRAAIRALPEGE